MAAAVFIRAGKKRLCCLILQLLASMLHFPVSIPLHRFATVQHRVAKRNLKRELRKEKLLQVFSSVAFFHAIKGIEAPQKQ